MKLKARDSFVNQAVSELIKASHRDSAALRTMILPNCSYQSTVWFATTGVPMCAACSSEAWDSAELLGPTLVCGAFLVFEEHDLRHLPRNRHQLMPAVLHDCLSLEDLHLH